MRAGRVRPAWERWPIDGTPDNPTAWLTTTARNSGLDRMRRASLELRKNEEVATLHEDQSETAASKRGRT